MRKHAYGHRRKEALHIKNARFYSIIYALARLENKGIYK